MAECLKTAGRALATFSGGSVFAQLSRYDELANLPFAGGGCVDATKKEKTHG
jgi:hypothetical protein